MCTTVFRHWSLWWEKATYTHSAARLQKQAAVWLFSWEQERPYDPKKYKIKLINTLKKKSHCFVWFWWSTQPTTNHLTFKRSLLNCCLLGMKLFASTHADNCKIISAKTQAENAWKTWLESAPWRWGKKHAGSMKHDEPLTISTRPAVQAGDWICLIGQAVTRHTSTTKLLDKSVKKCTCRGMSE